MRTPTRSRPPPPTPSLGADPITPPAAHRFATKFACKWWYGRPPAIDEEITERSRVVLEWMLLLHIGVTSIADADESVFVVPGDEERKSPDKKEGVSS